MRPYALFVIALLTATAAWGAGGIKGVIKADDGTPLAYATIYVKQTETGVASDMQGHYEVTLTPGTYDVLYQYLGYESVVRKVEVKDSFIVIDITMKTHVVVLQNLTIRAGKEDPAYTIMRKAIAKAKFHTQQLDSYTARVYIKGRGQLKDYPWLAKKALEKEGITKDRVFIQESVSDITYTRPNKFEEKVIAIYTTGKNESKQSPNAYVFGSFYEPEIAETVSPLAPKSFSYYRFEYMGTFKDRGFDISKIKVTPRSKGDNVVEGILYIVEDWWSIHSLDFNVTKLGVSAKVKQIYNPIDDKVWLPVSQIFKVNGKVFGFEFEGDYLATVKDYKITLNPALPQEMVVIDEKTQPEEAKEIKAEKKKQPTQKQVKNQKAEDKLKEGKEVTDKELRQLVKEYEKQELKESKQPDVISESTFSVDSLAYKKDSTFWNEMRPTPLTKEEVKGYEKDDSVHEVERQRNEGDTLRNSSKKNKKGFQPWDVLIGDSYRITETSSFRIHTPFGGYNTVEGVNVIYRTSLYKRWLVKDSLNKKTLKTYRLEISPVLRYSFAREKLTGFMRVDFRGKDYRLWLEGGRYVTQFNANEPIHSFVNTFTTLVLGNNYMKLYERDFIDLNYRHRFNDKYTLHSNWKLADRRELINNASYTIFKSRKEKLTTNRPENVELPSTSFEPNQSFIGSVTLEARPWQKYRIRNGNKQRVHNSTPVFSLEYRKGFADVFGSDVKFDQVELSVRKQVKLGIRGTLDVTAKGGKFLNNDKLYFMDYKHFMGNRTFFLTTDPTSSFRLLDYYRYSTADDYFEAHAHYHFRKFLLTYLPKARMLGLSENVFVNHLGTRAAHYTEVGYSIDGILRIFRIEGALSFQDVNFSDLNFAFRLGIATGVIANFND
ncbi:MAG TPA: DUF5686 and carboxypeptidase regulatory-like domain-containing protein [Cyclobacteriaceae bacterium]|nr:DUF5686 and carboxypeptidase regulatory-like domain-containing protein [Cyclobacteriaceae bacterium]